MYPTRAQILARPVTFRRSTRTLLRTWKREFRGRRRTNQAIEQLLVDLARLYRTPVTVRFTDTRIPSPFYNSETQTIVLDGTRPSVVSSLHEFAHHLFGPSELTACRWSVWLFRRTFPRTYRRLAWNGHMLVRRVEVCR